jgi:hypothetical protein
MRISRPMIKICNVEAAAQIDNNAKAITAVSTIRTRQTGKSRVSAGVKISGPAASGTKRAYQLGKYRLAGKIHDDVL